MTPQPKPKRLHHPALLRAVKAMTYAISRRIMDGGEPLTSDELVEIVDRELTYTEIRLTLDAIGRHIDTTRRALNSCD